MWIEDVFQYDPMWLALDDGPGGPANQAVDCVVALRLVEWKLVVPPVELVGSIL